MSNRKPRPYFAAVCYVRVITTKIVLKKATCDYYTQLFSDLT